MLAERGHDFDDIFDDFESMMTANQRSKSTHHVSASRIAEFQSMGDRRSRIVGLHSSMPNDRDDSFIAAYKVAKTKLFEFEMPIGQ